MNAECRLLLVDAPGIQWGLDAPQVRQAMDPRSYQGPPPIDVAAILGVAARGDDHRVLIVSTPEGPLALRAVGEIRIAAVARSEILELPAELPRTAISETVRAVIFREGAAPILLLRPERVAAAAGELP